MCRFAFILFQKSHINFNLVTTGHKDVSTSLLKHELNRIFALENNKILRKRPTGSAIRNPLEGCSQSLRNVGLLVYNVHCGVRVLTDRRNWLDEKKDARENLKKRTLPNSLFA